MGFMKKDVKYIVKQVASEKFFRYEYRKITTDEIARAAGISKRTLYEHFKNKEEIVKSIIMDEINRVRNYVESVLADTKSTKLDKIIKLFSITNDNLTLYNQELIFKLAVEVPEAFEIIRDYKDTFSEKILGIFIESQKSGYFRNDVDIVYILKIGILFRELINLESFKNEETFSRIQICNTFNKLFIQGILSKKVLMRKDKKIESLLENIGNEKIKKINI